MTFNEHALEMSIMELFEDEGYEHLIGSDIHREKTEVLLTDDIKNYLYDKYADTEPTKASKRMLQSAGIKCRQFVTDKKEIVLDFERE